MGRYIEMLFRSGRGEHKRIKAAFGAFSGSVVGCTLLILLHYSFEYSLLIAGICASVCTLFICIGLALFPTCRCIMALVFPNFFTGKGRAVLLSVILAFMLTGPILNITHNAKETGNTMACVIDLVANQSKILHSQLKEPVKIIANYVDQQRKSLYKLHANIGVDFKALKEPLDALETGYITLDNSLKSIYQACDKQISSAIDACTDLCNEIPKLFSVFDPRGKCRDALRSSLQAIKSQCAPLVLGDNFVEVTKQMRSTLDKAEQYFKVDFTVGADFSSKSNSSKPINTVQGQISEYLDSKVISFQTFMKNVKYVLSLSLVLTFLQAFLYFKNYMSKDGYDNIYITEEFTDLDKRKQDEGEESLLPLKKTERSEYIYTTSVKLNKQEFDSCKIGLSQVFLHATFCIVVVIFDYFLYYILNLVHTFGQFELDLGGQTRMKVKVQYCLN